MERERDVPETGSSGTNPTEQRTEYTVVGIVEDGASLNRAVREIRDLGVGREDLMVLLKRQDPDEPEPFPEGTLHLVPNDSRAGCGRFAVAFCLGCSSR